MPSRIIEAELEGLPRLQAKLKALREGGNVGTVQALLMVAYDIFNDSQRLCPVDTGTLRSSGNVEGPIEEDGKAVIIIGYGGAAAPYAFYVHENLDIPHDPPTQAKFLEVPFLMHVQGVSKVVADRIAAESGKRGY